MPVTKSGFNGAGQSITLVGQSAIVVSDIEAFQNASSPGVKDPTQVLVPGTGSPVAVAGDESESDIDLEWSSAMAPGANIFFVYTGCSNSTCSNNTYGVFDSIQYAVDEQIGNIISASYGACETSVSSTNFTAVRPTLP